MRGSCRVAGLILASALTGCAGFRSAPHSPMADQEKVIEGLNRIYTPDQIALCLGKPLGDQDACRNEIAQALFVAIDLRYAEFEQQFFDTNRYSSFGAAVATLGLTGAASVSSGGAAQILSAIAAGVIGTRESFGREVLIERTATALQTAMRTQRNLVLARIQEKLPKPATEYPLGFALSDLGAYYRAGTLTGALTGVNEAVSNEARIAREQLGRISPIAATPSASDLRQRFFATAAGPPRTAFMANVESIMRRLGIPGEAADVMLSPEREADRQAILRVMTR